MKLLNDLNHVASEINPAIHFCYFPKEIVDVGRKAYIHMQYNVMYNSMSSTLRVHSGDRELVVVNFPLVRLTI